MTEQEHIDVSIELLPHGFIITRTVTIDELQKIYGIELKTPDNPIYREIYFRIRK